MRKIILLSVFLAGAANAETLATCLYGPAFSKKADLSEYDRFALSPGDETQLVVHEVNLRVKPGAKAKPVAKLPLGTRVQIIKVASAKVRVGHAVNYWYEVKVPSLKKHGYLFGGAMGFAVLRDDLDGNGTKEIASVSWAPNYKIRVRVVQNGKEESLNLEAAGQKENCCGGCVEVELKTHPKTKKKTLRLWNYIEGEDVSAHHSIGVLKGRPVILKPPKKAK